ncbi:MULTISPECIES: hypothetical protein [unclassified Streptomyces]|uniref:hypothetical protein n=1 Tax=unclassified Streptomyces TaxID=2593676 RepID=UPI00070ACE59|nr:MULTISPECIES: hypothetical protein [unclassified Streptomyces]KRD22931.1 hypothetical protein ASE41_13645 [Streptomyces sp. Root264]
MGDPTRHPHIVVHPPALDGSRRVTSDDAVLGVASHFDDVVELLRLADLDRTAVERDDLVAWQGGGPDYWPGLSQEQHEE